MRLISKYFYSVKWVFLTTIVMYLLALKQIYREAYTSGNFLRNELENRRKANIENTLVEVKILGTSISSNQPWVDSLKYKLASCFSGKVTLDNFSKPAMNSQKIQAIDFKLKNDSANLIIIELMLNDADLVDGVSLQRSQDNHIEVIRNLTDNTEGFIDFLLVSPNSTASIIQRVKRPFLKNYYSVYSELSLSLGVSYLDLRPVWGDLSDKSIPIPDGLHPRSDLMDVLFPSKIAAALCPKLTKN
jgi:hypothetical protein